MFFSHLDFQQNRSLIRRLILNSKHNENITEITNCPNARARLFFFLNKHLKQVKLPISLDTHEPYSELPSNISTMVVIIYLLSVMQACLIYLFVHSQPDSSELNVHNNRNEILDRQMAKFIERKKMKAKFSVWVKKYFKVWVSIHIICPGLLPSIYH